MHYDNESWINNYVVILDIFENNLKHKSPESTLKLKTFYIAKRCYEFSMK